MRLAAPVFALALLSTAALPAGAQSTRIRQSQDTSDWLDDCRHDGRRWSDDDDSRSRHCEVRRTAARAGKALLTIDAGQNGGVSVVGGDVDSVVVVAKITTTGSSDSDAAEIARQVKVAVTPTSITADGPAMGHDRGWWVSFDVTVPRAADVSVETHNGPISLEGMNGRVEAHAVNGPLSVYDMAGDVTGRTQNGPITAELRGKSWNGRGLDLQTQNGPVTLRIADGYNAHLETGTVNGPMRIDFPVTVQGRITKHIALDLGSGGPTVRAVTTNGPVTVRRM